MSEENLLGVEEKEFHTFYKRSLFWIGHRTTIKRLALAFFFLVDLSMISYTAYAFLDFGVFHYFQERAIIGSITNGVAHFHTVSKAHAASGLKTGPVQTFVVDATRSDFYVELSNPNLDWQATFDYAFVSAGVSTPSQRGFILPGEVAKPLVQLALDTASAPHSPSLQVTNVVWTRVNHHAIGDYASWQSDRLNFVTTDVTFNRSVTVGTATLGRTTFTVSNHSAYGFWDPTLTIVLYRNDNPVGVTTVTAPSLAGGESREISVNWFGTVPEANATLIVPNIDLFDASVYLPLHGELVPDVRERVRSRR